MRTYVAMLRAINLGSRNRVSMPDLRALFDALGAVGTQTYVQSGNVVFRIPVTAPSELVRTIEDRVATDLGLEVSVLLRTSQELAAVVGSIPFAGGGPGGPAAFHVTFCAEAPHADRVRELNGTSFAPDELTVIGRDVYLRCPEGYGRSKLSNSFLENKLRVVATTRSWRTVSALAGLAGALDL